MISVGRGVGTDQGDDRVGGSVSTPAGVNVGKWVGAQENPCVGPEFAELVRKARAGDRDARNDVVLRLEPRYRNLARLMAMRFHSDREMERDMLSSALLSAYHGIDTYDPSGPRDFVHHMSCWAMAAMQDEGRRMKMPFRMKRSRDKLPHPMEESEGVRATREMEGYSPRKGGRVNTVETAAIRGILADEILNRIGSLPSLHRQVLEMRYYGKDGEDVLSYTAIGERMRVSRQRVEALHREGISKLGKMLRGGDDD